jgi:hypothetical protein
MTLHVEMDRLASLGPVLQGLADEVGDLRTGVLIDVSFVPPGMDSAAVDEARSIADDVDFALVPSVKERLAETGEIMVNVANEYRTANEPTSGGLDTTPVTSLESVMATYTKATGDWDVPEVPR